MTTTSAAPTRGPLIALVRQLDLLIAPRAGPLDAAPAVVQIVLAGVYVLEDALGDAHEGLLDVLAALGAGLDVLQDAVAPGPVLGLLVGDLALVVAVDLGLGLVQLVADQDHDDVRVRDGAQVVQPVRHVLERRLPRDVEDQQRARRPPEVGPRYGFVLWRCESVYVVYGFSTSDGEGGTHGFLPCRVPQRELHVFLGRVVHARGIGEPACFGLARGGGRRRRLQLGVRRADGDDARPELDADGDVVLGTKAALAQADGERGLAAARVPDADELGDVVPRRRRHEDCRRGGGRGFDHGGLEPWEGLEERARVGCRTYLRCDGGMNLGRALIVDATKMTSRFAARSLGMLCKHTRDRQNKVRSNRRLLLIAC